MKYKLLLKTHVKTNLKYLCKTIKDDYISYKGSGKIWKAHLKKYGRDVLNIVIYQTDDLEEFTKVCLHQSYEMDIVNSAEFANLKPEHGLDGGDTFSNQSLEKQCEIRNKLSLSSKKHALNRPKEWNDHVKHGRLNMTQEAKDSRCKKIQDVYATGKHDHLFQRYSLERRGANNPAAIKISIDGIIYNSICEAMDALNITRSTISSRLNSSAERWSTWFKL
jgi:hypothetical protein